MRQLRFMLGTLCAIATISRLSSRTKAVASVLLSMILLSVAPSLLAQVPASALTITVKDLSGANITGAALTLKGPGFERKAVSDASGLAVFSTLPPGDYDLRGVKTGFAPGVLKAITVLPGQSITDVMSLALAGVNTYVEVEGSETAELGLKSGIPIDQVPQSVQVLGEKEIVERGAIMLDDVLRAVPSVSVAGSRVAGGEDSTLRIRGLPASVIRNGVRQRYNGGVDTSQLSNIKSIQVLKGPSGVLFGQAGPGGLITIITKQPTEKWQGSVALTGGSFGQKMTTGDVGGMLSKTLGVRLPGEVERSNTFVHYIPINRENVGLTFAWRPSERVSAHLVTEYAERETVSDPGLPTIGTVISNGVETVDRSTFLGEPGYSLQANHAPLAQVWATIQLNHGWTLTPRFQYSEFNNLSKATILLTPQPGQPTIIQRNGVHSGEHDPFYIGQLDLTGQFSVFGIKQNLMTGFEYTDETVNFRTFPDVACGVNSIDALHPVYGCGPPTTEFGFRAPSNLDGYALYAQDQIALTKRWNVVAGVRYTDYSTTNGFVTAFASSFKYATLHNATWQLGTTYALGKGLSLFGGYNTGYDVEYVIGSRSANGTPFKPQKSDQTEGGVRFIRNTVHATASVFQNHLNNVTVPDPNNINFQIQEGQYRVKGVELDGEWSPLRNWWLQGGYAHLDAIVSRSTDPTVQGGPIAGTPDNTVTGATRVMLYKRLQLRAAGDYIGSTRILNGNPIIVPGYVKVDFGAGSSLGPMRLDLTLSNAFDKLYYYSDNAFIYSIGTANRVLPGTPRSLIVRLS